MHIPNRITLIETMAWKIIAITFVALFASAVFAADMSIIDYDRKHNIQPAKERSEAELMNLYESWLVKHKKNYNALGEKEKRFEIFKDNLRFVDEHNSVERSYKVGLNKFADLTNDQFRALYLGTRKRDKNARLGKNLKSDRYLFKDGDDLPDLVDWRANGAVVPVKDQGQCGM